MSRLWWKHQFKPRLRVLPSKKVQNLEHQNTAYSIWACWKKTRLPSIQRHESWRFESRVDCKGRVWRREQRRSAKEIITVAGRNNKTSCTSTQQCKLWCLSQRTEHWVIRSFVFWSFALFNESHQECPTGNTPSYHGHQHSNKTQRDSCRANEQRQTAGVDYRKTLIYITIALYQFANREVKLLLVTLCEMIENYYAQEEKRSLKMILRLHNLCWRHAIQCCGVLTPPKK